MNQLRKKLSVIMALIMVFSTFAPMAFGQRAELETAQAALEQIANDKLQSDVSLNTKDDKMVDVLIYMKDQVNTNAIAKSTKMYLAKTETPNQIDKVVKTKIHNSLKDTAEVTQASVIKYLEQEKEKGNVTSVESFHVVNMIHVVAKSSVIKNLSYMGDVAKVYPNKVHTMQAPLSGDTEPSVAGLEWNIARVNADKVWDMGYNGSGVVVATMDSGSTWNHPALMRQWRGYDAETGNTTPEGNWFDPSHHTALPSDSPAEPHGTHVMGTIVGQEANGDNKIGVAPGAKWIAARIFDNDGNTTDAIILSAAEWILAPGGDPTMAPDIVNNSWGGGDGIDDWFRDAVKNWRAAGILPVFAAGNQRANEPAPWPGSISVPSNYPESFAVGATDINNIRGDFSKLGPSPYDESLVKPNIAAPGVNIRSSVPTGFEGGWSGTSMAAPAVAGVAALLLSANQSLTVDELEDILEETANPLTDKTYPTAPNFGYGYGLVDALNAVASVTSGSGTITGTVLAPGYDMTIPEISHEQVITEIFRGNSVDVEVQAKDDVSIVEAELLIQPEGANFWITAPMARIAGTPKDGTYKGTIKADMMIADKMNYKVRVRDYAGDYAVSETYGFTVKFGALISEFDGTFENEMTNWDISGSWEIGESKDGDPSAVEGTKLAGTILGGNYKIEEDSWMITPPMDFRAVTDKNIELKFQQWYETEKNYDKGYLVATNDFGKTWKELQVITGVKKEWEEKTFDLSEFKGSKTPVFIAWVMKSDNLLNKKGWYVDDIRISEVDPPAEPTEPTEPVTPEKIMGKDGKPYVEKAPSRVLEQVQLKAKFDTIDASVIQNTPLAMGGIPLSDAVVTVVETGKSVKVDPATGKFSMRHPASEEGKTFTLRAEAYGHFNGEQQITLNDEQKIRTYFTLQPIPRGTISGHAFDRYYKTAAANARVEVLEDARVPVAFADENGMFTLPNVLEGTYTLKITAEGFEATKVTVTVIGNEIVTVDAPMKCFIGFENEIIYDDSTAENALVLNSAGNGLAVRFTPESYGLVSGVNIYFYDESWPKPGGTETKVAIYSTNDDGTPVFVGQTETLTVNRGAFNYIDLSGLGFSTSKDFYISTIQVAVGTESPGVGIDETSVHGDRSYLNAGGTFSLLKEADAKGGLLMHANMKYGVSTPEITNLPALSYSNQDVISVEGIVNSNCKINVYVNGEKTTTTDAVDGKFVADVAIGAENEIMVTAEVNGRETEPSQVVKVIQDKVLPELTVTNPLPNMKLNTEVLHVKGHVSDNFTLEKVTLNDKEIALDENGNFHERILLNPGENDVVVKAYDAAGNVSEVANKVLVNLEASEIKNMLPNTDAEYKAGEVVSLSFEAPAGGKGFFKVVLPYAPMNTDGVKMTENNGVYTAEWTVPEGLVANRLLVEFTYINPHGTKSVAVVPGTLTIVGLMQNLKADTVLIGEEAFDLKLVNSSKVVQEKMTSYYNKGGLIIIKLNKDTFITMDGQMVSLKNLPSRVTYFDVEGNALYYINQK